jgi:hypothetical protein
LRWHSSEPCEGALLEGSAAAARERENVLVSRAFDRLDPHQAAALRTTGVRHGTMLEGVQEEIDPFGERGARGKAHPRIFHSFVEQTLGLVEGLLGPLACSVGPVEMHQDIVT